MGTLVASLNAFLRPKSLCQVDSEGVVISAHCMLYPFPNSDIKPTTAQLPPASEDTRILKLHYQASRVVRKP